MSRSAGVLVGEVGSLRSDSIKIDSGLHVVENGKISCNPPLSRNSENSNIFHINRHSIESVAKEDQAHELQSLEISVYNQDVLERGIIKQVDITLVQQKNKQLMKLCDVQSKSLQEEIRVTEERLKKSVSSLQNLPIKEFCCNVNEALLLRKEIDSGMSSLQVLKSREQAFINERKLLVYQTLAEDTVNCSTEGGGVGTCLLLRDPKIDKQRKDDEYHTEKQRKVCLGKMTPFGTTISSDFQIKHFKDRKLPKSHIINNTIVMERKDKQFCESKEVRVNNPGTSGLNPEMLNKKIKEPKEIKRETVLKKRICNAVKKRRKSLLGTKTRCKLNDGRNCTGYQPSEISSSSGSEYLPSMDEESSDEDTYIKRLSPRKSQKHRKSAPYKFETDNSDWEYSDETVKCRRRRSKKVIDDGNLEDFLERLKNWEKEEKDKTTKEAVDECENGNGNFGFQELDGGLKIPSSIWNKLFSFQKVGVQWMWELHQQKCGGILGDEMGLGKTIQVIAFIAGLASTLLVNQEVGRRKCGLGLSLIVCPTTMLHQWVKEFHTWWPPVRVAILHDSGSFNGRGGKAALVKSVRSSAGILVTSYEGLSRMADDLSLLDWHLVVLDEGHIIRNPDARVTLAAKRLCTPHRLILSGSPLQNNLRELWSLFDFIYPGKLGTLPVFMAEFAIPITQGGYASASQVQVLFCRLTDEQRHIYQDYLKSGDVDKILTGTLKVFVGLINLRKICNHADLYTGGPKLLKWDKEESIAEEDQYGFWRKSGKMIVVENLLRIWHRQNHRVLLFTQGRQMMSILENFIRQQGYGYLKLDGATSISSRQPLINEFNQNTSHFIFLLTTKVGGLGVNLTGANRVLIYDPDWNPATDTQARERVWRPGQLRHVTVYRLVTAGTIEEKIYHRQIFKQFLADRVLRDPRRRRFFKSNDLYELFTLQEDGVELGKQGAKTETSAIFAGTGSEIKIFTPNQKSNRKTAIRENDGKDEVIHQNRLTNGMKRSKSESCKNKERSEINAVLKSCKETVTAIEIQADSSSTNDTKRGNWESITDITFSKEKIEMMKKMAQNLSWKIAKQLGHTGKTAEGRGWSDHTDMIECTEQKGGGKRIEQGVIADWNSARECCWNKKRKRRRKGRVSKECSFEGERVAHLVGLAEGGGRGQEDQEASLSQDNYVLRKLFAKSGLRAALYHDVIMQGGEADYALLEGEAERVAHEAVRALKESRRRCWAASAGVPTWTGQQGMLCDSVTSSCTDKPKSLRFGSKRRTQGGASSSSRSDHSSLVEPGQQNHLSSTELLSHIRRKESLLEYFRWKKDVKGRQTAEDGSSGEQCLLPTGVTREQADLLGDIRGFIACGAAHDGQATTKEILTRFKDRLPAGATPQLFKSMLKSVCSFENRESTGSGLWKLKLEFHD